MQCNLGYALLRRVDVISRIKLNIASVIFLSIPNLALQFDFHTPPKCRSAPSMAMVDRAVEWQAAYRDAKALCVKVVADCGRDDLARSLAAKHGYLEGTVALCHEAELRKVKIILSMFLCGIRCASRHQITEVYTAGGK